LTPYVQETVLADAHFSLLTSLVQGRL